MRRYRWWRFARCRVKYGRACPHLENHSGVPRMPRPRVELQNMRPAGPRARAKETR